MAKFDDSDDPLGTLEPLIEAIMAARAPGQIDDRQGHFAELRRRLTDHFEAVVPTLYAALRPFPQLALTLGQADRTREEVRLSLETLSLLPVENEEWDDVLRALDGIVRRYFEHTEPRLIEACALCLGRDELLRLGAEAIHVLDVRSRVHAFPIPHSETQHG